MRKIREVLRLKFDADLSDREIARATGAARSTVRECLRRAKEAGLTWPLPEVRIPAKPACRSDSYRATVPAHAGQWT